MFARVVTFQRSSPANLEQANTAATEQVLPAMRQQPGFLGAYVLSDRSSGKQLGISFWDTAEHARGTGSYNTMRDQTSNELADVVPPITEVFEAFDLERSGATEGSSAQAVG